LFVALVIQHTKTHIFCVISYCHVLPICLYHIFPHYVIKSTITENNLMNIKCVFWLYLQAFFMEYLSCKEEFGDTFSKMYVGFHVKCPSVLSDFIEIWISWTDFRKVLIYQILSYLSSVGRVPCRYIDRQT